jgi:hypothetical protein
MTHVHPVAPVAAALVALVALAASVFTTGCAPKRIGEPAGQSPPFLGETQTMAEVAAAINANNSALPTLWARHYFEATIVDEQKKSHFVNGDGVLLYKAPRGMRLVGTKAAAGTVFEIGSTDDRYWLTLVPERDTMWWGEYANLGKPCVDLRNIPVRPDLVLEVLGVGTINSNFLEPPVPTMRFNNDARAYMFVWSVMLPDRWAAQKEIWYDLETKLPRRVFLFDADGRVVLRAKLSRHEPVELEGVPAERWPKVARVYELFFPDTGSTMTFELDEVAPERRGVPTRRGIAFPEDAKVGRVIQLDENCRD